MKNNYRLIFSLFCLIANINTLRAQWTQTNGPNGGDVRALAYFGKNIFAGTQAPPLYNGDGAGLYISTDNGITWGKTGLFNKDIDALGVLGTNLFAETNNGLYISVDSSKSWSKINEPYGGIYSFATSGANLYAANYNGVYLSTNNGYSWANIGLAGKVARCIAISGTNIFVGTYHGTWGSGIFLSKDNGASWTNVGNSSTGLQANIDIYDIAFSGTNIFAGSNVGVFKSTNNGISWTLVNSGLNNTNVKTLAVSAGNIFAGTLGGIFRSSNNGTSWDIVGSGLTDNHVYALAASGTNILAGTDSGGVFLSINNGANWVNTGLSVTTIEALAVSGTNLFASVYGHGFFRSLNNGDTWTLVNTGISNTDVQSLLVSGTNIYAGTLDDGVLLSTNNGTSWTQINTGLRNGKVSALTVSDGYLFASIYDDVSGDAVYRSTNNGASWSIGKSGITNKIEHITSMASNGTVLFAGTASVSGIYGCGVYRSVDNGTTWTKINSGMETVVNATTIAPNVNALAVSGTDVFAATGGTTHYSGVGVCRSSDNGSTWKKNLGAGETITGLAVSGTNIYAVNSHGVFLSGDKGQNWTAVNTGLSSDALVTDYYLNSLIVGNGYLFLGTTSTGIWRRPLTEMVFVLPPSAPVLVFPSNGAKDIAINPTLTWNASNGANSYGIDISSYSDFSVFYRYDNITGTSQQVTNLYNNSHYYWRVYASNTGGKSTYSESRDFTTIGVTSVSHFKQIPMDYAIDNFPNPFNPSTTFSISLPSNSFVSLKIYDSYGKEVSKVIGEELPTGQYTRQWNAAGLPSGMYFYRLHAGSYTKTKRLILLK